MKPGNIDTISCRDVEAIASPGKLQSWLAKVDFVIHCSHGRIKMGWMGGWGEISVTTGVPSREKGDQGWQQKFQTRSGTRNDESEYNESFIGMQK